MNLKIKLLDKTLPQVNYQTEGSVGFDLYSRVDTEIAAKTLSLIPLNIIVKVPNGYMLMLASRSSTPKKKGLMVANGIGVIDQDYSGETDEIKCIAYNFTNETVKIIKGERIVQGILVKVATPKIKFVDIMSEKSRGGVGSTG